METLVLRTVSCKTWLILEEAMHGGRMQFRNDKVTMCINARDGNSIPGTWARRCHMSMGLEDSVDALGPV